GRRTSNSHDDLADLLVRLEVTMSLDDLLERESPGDDRLEAAVRETAVDELLGAFQPFRITGDLHHHVAANCEPAAQHGEQGKRSWLRAQGSVEEERSELGGRLG